MIDAEGSATPDRVRADVTRARDAASSCSRRSSRTHAEARCSEAPEEPIESEATPAPEGRRRRSRRSIELQARSRSSGAVITPSRYRGSTARTVISARGDRSEAPAGRSSICFASVPAVDVRNDRGARQGDRRLHPRGQRRTRCACSSTACSSARRRLGQYNWANLSSLDIDRIVVHRGPQTARFGAERDGWRRSRCSPASRSPVRPGGSTCVLRKRGAAHGRRTRHRPGLDNGRRRLGGLRAHDGSTASRPSSSRRVSPPRSIPFRNTTSSSQIRRSRRARTAAPACSGGAPIHRTETRQLRRATTSSSRADTRQRQFGLDWQQQLERSSWAMSVLVAQHDDRDRGDRSPPRRSTTSRSRRSGDSCAG